MKLGSAKGVKHIGIIGAMVLFMMLSSSMVADVKSTTGTLNFVASSNTLATLNSTGLGIGTSPSANLDVSGNASISQQLIIGNSQQSSSNLQIHGNMSFSPLSTSSNVTLNAHSYVLADTSSANLKVQLPYAGDVTGRIITIKKTSHLNDLLIAGGLIDGQLGTKLNSGNLLTALKLVSYSNQWYILSQPSSGLSNALASDNLLLWWTFDESSGSIVNDHSGRGHTGQLMPESSTVGVLGQAQSFSGSRYINVPSNTSLELQNQGTISFWIKRYILNEQSLAVSKKATWDNSNGYEVETGRTLVRVLAKGNDWADDTSTDIGSLDFAWHHVVSVIDNTTVQIYVDGQAMSMTDNVVLGLNADAQALHFGNRSGDNGGQFTGALDEVKIYNRALSSSEVQNLYAHTHVSANLVGYWNMDETTGTSIQDASGYGNHGTYSSARPTGPSRTTGVIGQGIQLDGSDDFITNLSQLNLSGNAARSIMCWAKVTWDGQALGVFEMGAQSSKQHFAVEAQAGLTDFAFNGWDADLDHSMNTGIAGDTAWHHIAITWDGTTLRSYLDGLPKATRTPVGALNTADTALQVGRTRNAFYLNGSIDEVMVFNKALSASEIQLIVESSRP